jgi:hypothetical protein
MSKSSILFCVLLVAGYANAQDLCTIAAATLPSVVKCTGTGAKVTLSASAAVPSGATLLPPAVTTTTLTFAVAENPCKAATASITITDSAKTFIPSGSQTIALTNGKNNFPVVSFAFPVLGTVAMRLEVTLQGGIDDAAGLTFAVAVGFCIDANCNSDIVPTALKSVFSGLLPVPVIPSFTIPNNLFKPADLLVLCPPPKPSSSDSLHASLVLAGVAAAAVFV